MSYTGVVEDIDDPIRSGRVRVRIFGLHTDDKSLIPTESLPWAQVIKSTDSAGISGIGWAPHGLVCGSWVKVDFEDDDKQYPFVTGTIVSISSSPNEKVSYEEIAFGITKYEESVESPSTEVSNIDSKTACEANVNIDKFKSKFNSSNVNAVLFECCDQGISNPFAKIAILSVVANECGFTPKNESFKYTVSRLRQVFPTKTASYTDYQLADIVKSEEDTANFLYGGRYGNSKTEGFKFRGRGFIQITFKSNYEKASKWCNVDFIEFPDKLNIIPNAAKSAVKYVIERVGGVGVLNGFEDQKYANKIVASAVIGKNISFISGYGLEYITKINNYSDLGFAIGQDEKATPIGNKDDNGNVSDGLTPSTRYAISNSNTGFKDPTGKYPKLDLINEPDTNRQTRRNTNNFVFNKKKEQRRTGIENVGGSFNQPRSPYNSKYPYNRGYFSESGHAIELDDTVGQERLSVFHRSGTFYEIDNLGNRVNKIIGSDYTIIEKNGYLYVDGTVRLTVASTANITIMGDVNFTVDGNYNLDVGGDINIKSGGAINLHSSDDLSIKSSSNLSIDGTRIDLNDGKSKDLGPSSRDSKNNDYPEILGESIESAEMIAVDDMDATEADSYIETAIVEGKLTKEDVETDAKKAATEKDDTGANSSISALPGNCAIFKDRTNIPDSTYISKFFTLGDLTTKVALPSERNRVVAHMGLSESEIVCNLKMLAENSLDPIKDRYSDMIITNAFRKNTNKSQHNIGKAADLQFTTASGSDYFEIAKWIKNNVLFDQLILEYRSNGRPWIHISYTESPRKMVMTFMNHKKYSDGLSQLG
jgi:predicted chitinase